MATARYAGIDLGTTAVKASVYDVDQGCKLGSGSAEYDLSTPSKLWVEVDPETYWSAFKQALQQAIASASIAGSDLTALAFSAQGETLFCLDGDGRPLRPAIVWLDGRAESEAQDLSQSFPVDHFYSTTGQVSMVPTWPAAKILWLQRHEPRVFERTATFALIEDYFIHRLTGEFACEGSLVTSTCYWRVDTKGWWDEMLAALNIDAGQLPPYVESGTRIAHVIPSVASELGLSPSTLVCSGGLDQACGAIGVGNVAPGIFSENTGAALAICATVDRQLIDPQRRLPCHYHAIPDTFMLHTFTSGGILLRWYRDTFGASETSVAQAAGMDAYDVLSLEASRVPAGSLGLTVLPHLQGAMAPEDNPRARGVIFGLTLQHGRAEVVRAIMESIAYAIRRNLEIVEALSGDVSEIRSLGGGSRSKVWKQIEADVTGRPVVLTTESEAATLGAALLAAIATGYFGSVQEGVLKLVKLRERIEPQSTNRDTYDHGYGRYVELYDRLVPLFETG